MDNKIKYNKDIISQLIKLQIGDMEEIINAMNNVINKNDINEILDYINKNKQIKSNQSNVNSAKQDIFSSLLSIIGEENKNDIIDAMNNVSHKNDIDSICYFLINQSKPPSTSYVLLYLYIVLLIFF